MSYSFFSNCNGCKKLEKGCKDAQKVQMAIQNDIHLTQDGSHQGAGTVEMKCQIKEED